MTADNGLTDQAPAAEVVTGYDGGAFMLVLRASPLHWKTKAVGFAMASHGIEGSGKCVVSIEDLASLTGLPCLSVEQGLNELAGAGFLAGEDVHDRYADHEALTRGL